MRRTIFAVAVTASLLASGAGPVAFEKLWTLLSSLTGDAGCIWDPNGQCRPAQQVDAGCGWDPNGQCRPAQQVDEGCIWDPNGRCATAPGS